MAINDYPFIKTDYLKTYAIPTLNKNIDDNHLVPYIYNAQSRYLLPSLGSFFFNDLKTKGKAGTLSANEITLIDDYIKPMVMHYTMMTLLEDGASTISNKGIQERNSTFSNPMPQSEVIGKVSKARNRADDYRARLVKYLCDNTSQFPALSTTEIENIYRNYKTYTSPVYFGNNYSSCCNRYPNCRCNSGTRNYY